MTESRPHFCGRLFYTIIIGYSGYQLYKMIIFLILPIKKGENANLPPALDLRGAGAYNDCVIEISYRTEKALCSSEKDNYATLRGEPW